MRIGSARTFIIHSGFEAVLVTLILLGSVSVSARQGCCSWHSGVCGCSCCDGSPLSAKCLPYYPACTQGQRAPDFSTPAPESNAPSSSGVSEESVNGRFFKLGASKDTVLAIQ